MSRPDVSPAALAPDGEPQPGGCEGRAARAARGVVDMVLTGKVTDPRRWCERLMACAGDASRFRSLEDAVPRQEGRVDVYLFADFDGEDVLTEAAGAFAERGLPFPAQARLVWLRPDGVSRDLWVAAA